MSNDIEKNVGMHVNLENVHDNAEETSEIEVNSKGGIVIFTKKFACLGLVMIFY